MSESEIRLIIYANKNRLEYIRAEERKLVKELDDLWKALDRLTAGALRAKDV